MDRSRREVEFDQFVLGRLRSLRRTAFLVVHDWHTAEDVVQGVLVKLYAAWPRLRPETIDAYARRAVVNACISYARKRRPETPTWSVPEQAARLDDEVSPSVIFAMQALTPVQRAVVALRFLEDLPVADVAQLLDVAESTVKTHTTRALATLREHLPKLATQSEERQ